jgi:hypothetical protein
MSDITLKDGESLEELETATQSASLEKVGSCISVERPRTILSDCRIHQVTRGSGEER